MNKIPYLQIRQWTFFILEQNQLCGCESGRKPNLFPPFHKGILKVSDRERKKWAHACNKIRNTNHSKHKLFILNKRILFMFHFLPGLEFPHSLSFFPCIYFIYLFGSTASSEHVSLFRLPAKPRSHRSTIPQKPWNLRVATALIWRQVNLSFTSDL